MARIALLPAATKLVVCAFAVGAVAAAMAAEQSAAAANGRQGSATAQTAKQAPADRPIMRRADADYQKAMKACGQLPLSQRTTCASEAGNSAALAANARREVAAAR